MGGRGDGEAGGVIYEYYKWHTSKNDYQIADKVSRLFLFFKIQFLLLFAMNKDSISFCPLKVRMLSV